jgi:hypothetical protein
MSESFVPTEREWSTVQSPGSAASRVATAISPRAPSYQNDSRYQDVALECNSGTPKNRSIPDCVGRASYSESS